MTESFALEMLQVENDALGLSRRMRSTAAPATAGQRDGEEGGSIHTGSERNKQRGDGDESETQPYLWYPKFE
jgi:hypothetical protein